MQNFFHLITPQTLRDNIEPEAAKKQVEALVEQIKAIEQIEERDHQALKNLGFGATEPGQTGTQNEGGESNQRAREAKAP